jgi:hypothetical protein
VAIAVNTWDSLKTWNKALIVNKQVFRLTLVPNHQPDDPQGFRRMRMVLKRLLRGFGFRCTLIEYPEDKPEGSDQEGSDG